MSADNLLSYTTFALLLCLAIFGTMYNFQEISRPFSRDNRKVFDKSALPKYGQVLMVSALILAVFALGVTRNLLLAAIFILGNMFFVAIVLGTVILYRPPDKESNNSAKNKKKNS